MKNLKIINVTFLTIFSFSGFMNNFNAQQLNLKTYLPKEYQFNIKEEKEQEGIFSTSYVAVDPTTKVAPFEIIVTEMPKSLAEINGMAKNLEQNIQQSDLNSQFLLINKEEGRSISRHLYKVSNQLSTVLILMQEKQDKFTMVEAEFHTEDFKIVSLEKWQTIFWSFK